VIIDMGAQVEGYAADLTRTVWVGEPTPRLRDVYNAVLAAQAVALDAIRPGASGTAIDQAVRDACAAAGFGSGVIHGVGHGVGLRVHESPSLSIHGSDVLEPGHVVTVEPGLYFPDWGGVRIEDVVLVTQTGFEMLTSAPKAH
jgi:Xaa-Pro aminopeptidase